MAKLSLSLVTLAITLVLVLAAEPITEQQMIADLVKRAEGILTKARTELKSLQERKSYFAAPLEDKIHKGDAFIREIQALAKANKLTPAQLGLVEGRLLAYENELLTFLLIESEASKDLTFAALIQMVDKLLQRAYTDLGKLVTDQSANHHLVEAIRTEITSLKVSEDEIKRLNAGVTEAQTVQAVEKLIQHETILDNLLFLAEHESIMDPKMA